MRWFTAFALAAAVVFAPGCGAGHAPPEGMAKQAAQPEAAQAPAAKGMAAAHPQQPPQGAEQAKQGRAGDKADAPAERKIIFTAAVDLIVDDFDQGEAAMLQLLQERRGYVARSEVRGNPGSPRSATWTVRVPVGRF